MKLLCTVSIGNRALPTLNINSKRKHVKSTIALCKNPKSNEHCLIHFTAQNKTGNKYDIKDNISSVLTKFISEGKTTIQFKSPPHDLYIQADTIQLKGFLHLLRSAIEKKTPLNQIGFSSMSVTPAKKVAPKKLVITKRSEYPLKGFPRTLEALYINDIERCSLDKGILNLIKLKLLNLSNNCIEFLPEEFSTLPSLTELNISHNNFFKSSPKQWCWLGGNLSKNLKLLNVSDNHLKFLPDEIVTLHSLITLNVDNNEIKLFPSGVGNLRYLKIITASNNQISSLPSTAKKWKLESLDLSGNTFDPNYENNPAALFPKQLGICSLKELTARKVLYARLYFSPCILPRTVIHFLNVAKYCVCGKACFYNYIRHPHMLSLAAISQTFTVSSADLLYVPIDCYFCSIRCSGIANYRRPGYVMR